MKPILSLSLLLVLLCPQISVAQKKKLADYNWPVLKKHLGENKAFETLPPALLNHVPFEVQSLYSIPDNENRAQLYFRIAFCLEASGGGRLAGTWNTEALSNFQGDRDFDKRMRATQKALRKLRPMRLRKRNAHQSKRVFYRQLTAKEISDGKKILKDLQWVLDEMKIATHQRSKCFFPRFHKDPIQSFDGSAELIRDLNELALLRLLLSKENDIDLIESLLQFSLDQIPLNEHGYRQSTLEEIVLQGYVSRHLDNAKTAKEIGDLIDVLLKYDGQRRKLNVGLEESKARFLSSVFRWMKVAEPHYRRSLQTHKQINTFTTPQDLFVRAVPISAISKELQNADRHFTRLKKATAANFSAAEMQALEKLEKDFHRTKIDFFSVVTGMTSADFAREIQIERQRFQELEDAYRIKNFDEQKKKLFDLGSVWTLDGSWKASTVRMLGTPGQRERSYYHRYLFNIRGALALAAATKFRMAKGKNPDDLKQAFTFAGLGDVLTDPFTGKPFQLQTVGTRIGIMAEDTEQIPFTTDIQL